MFNAEKVSFPVPNFKNLVQDILRFFVVYFAVGITVTVLFYVTYHFYWKHISPHEQVYSDLWRITELAPLIPLVLACFSVFFAKPARSFCHYLYFIIVLFLMVSAIAIAGVFIVQKIL